MKTYRLKITDQTLKELQGLVFADLPREAGAFALAGATQCGNNSEVLVRRTIAIPKGQFSLQHELRLEISAQAINGLIALCESNGLGAVLCHSHPYDIPYSGSDDHGEKRIVDVLRRFIPPKAPTASLLFYPGGLRGRVWIPNSTNPVPLSEIVIVGQHLRRIQPDIEQISKQEYSEEVFDRQVRAFGKYGQATIARTKVGIVGVGGTGSPTAEQLVRMGVTDLMLIDLDEFDPSNVTRVYGTFTTASCRSWWPNRKKPKKVELVAAHLKKINPKARIQAIPGNIVFQDVARKLLDRDIMFLCTDNHWSRSIVNQVAYQYLIPAINMGVRVDAQDGRISEARGTIDLLRPGMPCLWCSQFLRADRITAESMPDPDRTALEREGYVEGIGGHAPSVVSMTTAVSGMAVTMFLQLVTDFMGVAGEIARLNYSFMDGTVRRGKATVSHECVCKKVQGFGDLKILPTL